MALAPRSMLAALSLAAAAHAQESLWLTQIGTSGADFATSLGSDGAGGALAAGYTEGSLGGPNQGVLDAWFARYDASGNQIFITSIGTQGNDFAYGVAPDDAGGAFIAGHTGGNLGGPLQGSSDAWLARYAGNQTWIKQFGTDDGDFVRALAPDGAGGTFIAGHTFGSFGQPNQGLADAWIARYDSSGNQLWIAQWGTDNHDSVYALTPDGAGGVFVGGDIGTAGDGWLARYDADGNQTWLRQFGSDRQDHLNALAPDGDGGTFIAGYTQGDFGGPNQGNYDAWLARYDAGGNQTWLKQLGSIKDDQANGLASDGAGGVFVAGLTYSDLGGPNLGKYDAWLARYHAEGNQTWIEQLGTIQGDDVQALLPDGDGGVFAAGQTFGPFGGPKFGDQDIWLGRFSGGDAPDCYPDLDENGALNLFDFLGFVNLFNAADPEADCTDDGVFNLFDFLCFVNAFNKGC